MATVVACNDIYVKLAKEHTSVRNPKRTSPGNANIIPTIVYAMFVARKT